MKLFGKSQIFVLLFSIFILNPNVNAKENIYYKNKNNVIFSEKEYDFITELFYEGYQNIISSKDYDNIFEYNSLNGIIETKIYNEKNTITSYGTSHSTGSKTIKISKSCMTNCLITIVATWKKSPNIRSYDVIGAFLEGVDFVTYPVTTVNNSTGSRNSSETIINSNGFGVSIKLLETGDDMIVSQYFRTTKNGTIFGSYQHAAKNITLANSKRYVISKSGYGGVFKFESGINNYYDGMGGVNISV